MGETWFSPWEGPLEAEATRGCATRRLVQKRAPSRKGKVRAKRERKRVLLVSLEKNYFGLKKQLRGDGAEMW